MTTYCQAAKRRRAIDSGIIQLVRQALMLTTRDPHWFDNLHAPRTNLSFGCRSFRVAAAFVHPKPWIHYGRTM